MAIHKVANAEIMDVVSMQGWEKIHGKQSFRNKTAAKKVADEYTKYLLNHCTIMASVMTEPDPEDHLIKPETAHFVNNNDDAWTNEVLRLSYRSFCGAFNFVEHYQNSKEAKGHIIDSVLRKVYITDDIYVYYCDILVATDLSHESLVSDIRAERVKYMSMGCLTDVVICSFCGARCGDPETYCEHLSFRKGSFLYDEGGVPRRVAELSGHKSLPNGGVRFVEASWVHTPAFPGAAQRSTILEEWSGPKTPYTKQAKQGILKAASGKTGDRYSIEQGKVRAGLARIL